MLKDNFFLGGGGGIFIFVLKAKINEVTILRLPHFSFNNNNFCYQLTMESVYWEPNLKILECPN